jgi:hypothetical protein
VNGKVKTPLLCMTPLLNEPNDDLSAVAHREFLANLLPRDFSKQVQQCVFIGGDNCSVYRRLSTFLGVPLVRYIYNLHFALCRCAALRKEDWDLALNMVVESGDAEITCAGVALACEDVHVDASAMATAKVTLVGL